MSKGNQIMLWVGIGTGVLIAGLLVAGFVFAPDEVLEEAKPRPDIAAVETTEPLDWVEQAHQPVMEVTDPTFEAAVLGSERPVLVDFWAAWCGPCVEMAPVVEQFAEQHRREYRVAKLDVEKNPQTARKYLIDALPTLVVFYDGQEIDRFEGLMSLEELVEELEEVAEQLAQGT